jgi:hypothetical protein
LKEMKKLIAIAAMFIFMVGVASAQSTQTSSEPTEKKEHVVKEKSSCSGEKVKCSKGEEGKACCNKDKGVTGSASEKKEGCSGEKKEGCCSKGDKKDGAKCCSKDAKKEEHKDHPKP